MKGKMRSVQVSKPKGPLEIVERDIPEPGARQVRIVIGVNDEKKSAVVFRDSPS